MGGRPGLHRLQRLAPGRHQEGLRGDGGRAPPRAGRLGRRARVGGAVPAGRPEGPRPLLRGGHPRQLAVRQGRRRVPAEDRPRARPAAQAADRVLRRRAGQDRRRGRRGHERPDLGDLPGRVPAAPPTADDEVGPVRAARAPAPRATCPATSRSTSGCAIGDERAATSTARGNGPIAAFLEVHGRAGLRHHALRLRRARAQRRRRRAGRGLRRAAGRRRAPLGRRHRRRHLHGIPQGDRLGA